MLLYLAGGEAWFDLLLEMGVKNQLFSYFYFRQSFRGRNTKARQVLARMRKAKERGYCFMLDSGAFTYQAKASTPGAGLPAPQGYFEEYKDFVNRYGDLFNVIVELDIDNSVTDPETGQKITTSQVDDWTNELLVMPEIASKVMPVFHEHRGVNWLDSYLKDTSSPLVGLASRFTDAGAVSALLGRCHIWGKYVHGFAQTRIRTDMKYTSWDSVDSTTWLRADKYGGTCIYWQDKFIVLDHLHKADRQRYRDYYESWGLDMKKIAEDDLHENRRATIIAWRELANSFERRHAARGGRHPYLYEMHRDGKVPATHPRFLVPQEKQ